jgi:hypothetical protein
VVDGPYFLSDGSLYFNNAVFRPAYSMPTVARNLKIYSDVDNNDDVGGGDDEGDDDDDYRASTYILQLNVMCNKF